jgi:hypothetical protein
MAAKLPDDKNYKKSDVFGYGEQFEKEYKSLSEKEKASRQPISQLEDELYKLKKEREKLIVARQAMPRTEIEPIEKIRIQTEKVMGNLFDRVRFLSARIDEIESNISLREKLHKAIDKEIDADIEEKMHLAETISDSNERRNLKLDISVLRKEKRHEAVQFWKDVMELTLELRELREQHETEKKIASLFVSDEMSLNGGN